MYVCVPDRNPCLFLTAVSDDGKDVCQCRRQFGVLCSDGAFVQPSAWPLETSCAVTDTCTVFPVPTVDSLYKPLSLTFVPTGTDIYYQVPML